MRDSLVEPSLGFGPAIEFHPTCYKTVFCAEQGGKAHWPSPAYSAINARGVARVRAAGRGAFDVPPARAALCNCCRRTGGLGPPGMGQVRGLIAGPRSFFAAKIQALTCMTITISSGTHRWRFVAEKELTRNGAPQSRLALGGAVGRLNQGGKHSRLGRLVKPPPDESNMFCSPRQTAAGPPSSIASEGIYAPTDRTGRPIFNLRASPRCARPHVFGNVSRWVSPFHARSRKWPQSRSVVGGRPKTRAYEMGRCRGPADVGCGPSFAGTRDSGPPRSCNMAERPICVEHGEQEAT